MKPRVKAYKQQVALEAIIEHLGRAMRAADLEYIATGKLTLRICGALGEFKVFAEKYK